MLPVEGLEKAINSRVTATLRDGTVITGKLAGVDSNINIVIEDGSASSNSTTKNLGKILVRGNSILSISIVG